MHVRRGRYLVDQTINNARSQGGGRSGEEARRKQHTQEVHLDQGYPPSRKIPEREQIEGDTEDPNGLCVGEPGLSRRRLLFAVLPLITH